MSKALEKAMSILDEAGKDSTVHKLDGFDGELLAVVEPSFLTLVQAYSEDEEPVVLLLHDVCYQGLLKILSEQING